MKKVFLKILFCSYIFFVQEQHGILAVFFRCPVQEHPYIFAGFFRYSLTWILEKSWYVPVFYCWPLVKKLISQKTLLCVVICANENWVALPFQDSLVLCSVKCNVWPFGTILVWRSRSWVRARGPGAIKPHNEKLADHFQQTQMTSNKKPDYWLSFPPRPHRFGEAPGGPILDFGFWILDFGFRILDFGFLDFGFRILDFGFWGIM